MTKVDRELLIGEAVRHYTHTAHHVEEDGGAQWFSRSDAVFILALAAATVSRGICRTPLHEVAHLSDVNKKIGLFTHIIGGRRANVER